MVMDRNRPEVFKLIQAPFLLCQFKMSTDKVKTATFRVGPKITVWVKGRGVQYIIHIDLSFVKLLFLSLI